MRCKGTYDQVHSKQTTSSPHQTLASAESVDDLGRDDGADDTDSVKTTSKSVLLDLTVTSLTQQNRTVSSDGSDTRPRCHNLQPNAQPSSTAQMSTLAFVKTKHDLDKLDRGSRLGVFSHGDNLVELLLYGFRIGRAADGVEDFACFFVSAYGSEVAWGVREHLDTREEEQSREALESEQEAPAQSRVSMIDEGETKVEPVGDGDAEIVCNENVTQEAATVFCAGDFRDEDRSDASESC